MNPWTEPHTQKCQYSILPCHDVLDKSSVFMNMYWPTRLKRPLMPLPLRCQTRACKVGNTLLASHMYYSLGEHKQLPNEHSKQVLSRIENESNPFPWTMDHLSMERPKPVWNLINLTSESAIRYLMDLPFQHQWCQWRHFELFCPSKKGPRLIHLFGTAWLR